jgi:hypothetical protein
MRAADDLRMYARFIRGLKSFMEQSVSLEEAHNIIRQRLARRDDNFLRLVERGIFSHPSSPYLPLLKLAGCELGDIRSMVQSRGLEETLRKLREAGVYFSFEEFKGREPVTRHGRLIPIQARVFDNPFLKPFYYGRSGGTTGAGTRIPMDLDHLADRIPNIMLALNAHQLLDEVPVGLWFGTPPSDAGINETLTHTRLGQKPGKWFAPVVASDLKPSLKYRMGTHFIVALSHLVGAPIPMPELLRVDRAEVAARWMAESLETHGTCLFRTMVSLAMRVSMAACEAGLDLNGATIMAGGEVPTPAKVRQIKRSGARWIPNYYFSEAGAVGIGCSNPADENDNHLFSDSFALIRFPRPVPGMKLTVEAFNFTTLLPSAPKLLLNVESDDYGIIEDRSCGCPMGNSGLTEHIRLIRSFRKLTGEGMTLVGSEMIRILEEVLPARFGGGPLDYQLLEEEDHEGFTRLSLVVSPRLEIADESEVVKTVFESLKHSSAAADLARVQWIRSGTIKIRRMEPVWTDRGKLMPLQISKRFEIKDS